ncbi:hypothetical protein ACJX0J_023660, partial [Zea mays]
TAAAAIHRDKNTKTVGVAFLNRKLLPRVIGFLTLQHFAGIEFIALTIEKKCLEA